jgi:amino acid/peptide:H+ symporter
MWERYSFYGIRPLLILFMTAALATGGFNFSRETAGAIVGIYSACVYLSALPGGWIADRLLGLRKAIWYGAILIALGHLSIALSIVFAHSAFFIGLILIVFGTGLLKPNISALVGDLYPEGGARRDAGFSIFYMGINLGALVAPLITGYLGEKIAWHLGFGAAGVGMLIGVFIYWRRADKTLGDAGIAPASKDPAEHRRIKMIVGVSVGIIVVLVLLAMSGVMTINPVSIARRMTVVIVAMALLYFAYVFIAGGLDREEKKRVLIIFLLFGDLLVRIRAGADVAQPVRARFHQSRGVRLGDADALASVREFGVRDRAGAGLRNDLDCARKARQGSIEYRKICVGTVLRRTRLHCDACRCQRGDCGWRQNARLTVVARPQLPLPDFR